jgi:hypothetical protein
MRRPLTITLGLLLCASGAIVACAEDDPEPGYTQTGGSGGSEASGGSSGTQGGSGSGGSGQGAGGSAGAGGSSSGGQGGGGGTGGAGGQGAACAVDANEPNNSPVQPTRVITAEGSDNIMSDCDDEDSTRGLLDGSEDEDWFVFTGQDDSLCGSGDDVFDEVLQPQARIDLPSSAEVCVFVKPKNGTVSCDSIAQPDDALIGAGYTGCCNAGGARALLDGSKGLGDENDNGADVLIRVSKLSSDALCGAYELKYSFVDP